jgi:hypothetical protein
MQFFHKLVKCLVRFLNSTFCFIATTKLNVINRVLLYAQLDPRRVCPHAPNHSLTLRKPRPRGSALSCRAIRITISMYQITYWEANSSSTGQDKPGIRRFIAVCESLPLDCVLNHMNRVYISKPYFFMICLNIIHSFLNKYPKWSSPFWFYEYNNLHISYVSNAC